MKIDTIKKNIENLKKVKSTLKGKIQRVDLQIAKMENLLSKEKVTEKRKKLKHIITLEGFFQN